MQEIKLNFSEIINPEDFLAYFEDNDNGKFFIFLDHGFVLGAYYGTSLSDAFDEMFDKGKLDQFKIDEQDLKDYPNEQGISFLGNHCTACDIENVFVLEYGKENIVDAVKNLSFNIQFSAS